MCPAPCQVSAKEELEAPQAARTQYSRAGHSPQALDASPTCFPLSPPLAPQLGPLIVEDPEQWFPTRGDFVPHPSLRKHFFLAMSGDIFSCHNLEVGAGGTPDIMWAEPREAAKHPAVHSSPLHGLIQSSVSAEDRKLWPSEIQKLEVMPVSWLVT